MNNDPVHIDKNDNVVISLGSIKPVATYTHCSNCGTELFGGEVSGEDANGLCDTCNV